MRVGFCVSLLFFPYIIIHVFDLWFIGSLFVWNQKVVEKGYTFLKPNVLKHKSDYSGHKAMANYIIKATEWKVFAWEFSMAIPFSFCFFCAGLKQFK